MSQALVLIGNPNVGKSLIFTRLTQRYATVSNYPGTTVEITSALADIGGLGRIEIDAMRKKGFSAAPSDRFNRVQLGEMLIREGLRDVPAMKGLLDGVHSVGLEVDPGFPARPYLYVSYTYDGLMRAYEQSQLRLGLTWYDVAVIHDLDFVGRLSPQHRLARPDERVGVRQPRSRHQFQPNTG